LSSEFTWRSDYVDARSIDSKFIDIISDIAWKYGLEVVMEEGQGKVRIPGNPRVYINLDNREVDFSDVPEEFEEDIAISVQQALDDLT
jgi:hypothetical protein